MADRIVGLLVIVLGTAYYRMADGLPTPLLKQAVGPEAFPKLLAVCLVILGAALIALPLLRRPRPEPAVRPSPAREGGPDAGEAVAQVLAAGPDRDIDYRTIALVVAGLAGYSAAYEPLGFIPSTALFMTFEIAVMEVDRGHWGRTLPVAVGTAIGLYLLFDKVLTVTLPTGTLFFP